MMPLTETGALGPTGALVAAVVIGFAFGWFLERAGLGIATKLVGQFYLRDFTVLKVLFSALVTALIGSFWLDRIGVLKLDLVYVPETFLIPQALGGIMFGAGLVVAGLCPGTACVAAATGRLDGLGVIAGMLLGVAGFDAAYASLQPLVDSTSWGAMTMTGLTGIPQGAGVAAVTMLALVAFAIVGRLEGSRAAAHRVLVAGAVVLSVAAAAADTGRKPDARALAQDVAAERDHVSAPELATWIMQRDSALQVFDLRSAPEYERFHIPTARLTTLEALASTDFPREARIVLYSEGGAHAAQGWMILRLRGYRNVFFLREGLYEWLARVHEPKLADDATPTEREQFDRAVEMSRYFGGMPHAGVPRSEVPTGYWTNSTDGQSGGIGTAASSPRADAIIAGIRRRGC
jgi:rhodanese-related sulfurtransferase